MAASISVDLGFKRGEGKPASTTPNLKRKSIEQRSLLINSLLGDSRTSYAKQKHTNNTCANSSTNSGTDLSFAPESGLKKLSKSPSMANDCVFEVVNELMDIVVKNAYVDQSMSLVDLTLAIQSQTSDEGFFGSNSSSITDADYSNPVSIDVKVQDDKTVNCEVLKVNEKSYGTEVQTDSSVAPSPKSRSLVPGFPSILSPDTINSIAAIKQRVQVFFDKFRQTLLVPGPSPEIMTIWRNVISTAYQYPCILKHEDLRSIYELFLLLGIKLQCDSTDIYIELEQYESRNDGSSDLGGKLCGDTKVLDDVRPRTSCAPIKLRPPLPADFNGHPLSPVNLIFGHIEDCEYDFTTQIVVVRKYGLLPNIKRHMEEMVQFLLHNPEQLYSESLGFVYDFLVRLGVKPNKIRRFVDLLAEGESSQVHGHRRKSRADQEEDQENADSEGEESESLPHNRRKWTRSSRKVRIMKELNNNLLKRKSTESRSDGEEGEGEETSEESSDNSDVSGSTSSSESEDEDEPFEKVKRNGKFNNFRNNIKKKYLKASAMTRVDVKNCRVAARKRKGTHESSGVKNDNEGSNSLSNNGNVKVRRRVSNSTAASNSSDPGVVKKRFACISTSGCTKTYSRRYEMAQHFYKCHSNEPVPAALQITPQTKSKINNEDKPIACPSKNGCNIRFLWQRCMLIHCRRFHPDEPELLNSKEDEQSLQNSPATNSSNCSNNNENATITQNN